MLKLKVMVILVCILITILTYTIVCVDEKPKDESAEDNSVTFYDLVMDFDTSRLDFTSYEPGDIVTVKDRISKTEIKENRTLDHNGRDYEYSVNIWLDSVKQLSDYLRNQPSLTIGGEHNNTIMESNFQVGDDITIHFIIGDMKTEPSILNPIERGELTRESAVGFKVVNVNGMINDDRSEVEVIKIKVGMLAGSPDINIHDTIIEISWRDNEPRGKETGETTLLHYNSTAFFEMLEFIEIENRPGVHITETVFDYIEKNIHPNPLDIDVFWYETLRDLGETTTSIGIINPGDIINISFNFSQYQKPPTGGGLDPRSSVEVKIIPKHGIPTLEEFYIPDVFPKTGKEIQL